MDLQRTILNRYLELNEKPTLKKIAKDTGIQLTRVFRILNGSTMKLSEYQIINKKVQEKLGLQESLESLASECEKILSPEAISDLEVYLKRKREVWKLLQKSKTQELGNLTA